MLVRRTNLILLILAVFGLLGWSLNEAGSLKYPLAYPQAMLLIIGGLFLSMLVADLRKAPSESASPDAPPQRANENGVALARFFATVTLAVIYVLVWEVFGYFPSTLLFILLLLLILGERGWLVVLGLPVALTILIYLVFYKLLLLPLPMGPLENIL